VDGTSGQGAAVSRIEPWQAKRTHAAEGQSSDTLIYVMESRRRPDIASRSIVGMARNLFREHEYVAGVASCCSIRGGAALPPSAVQIEIIVT